MSRPPAAALLLAALALGSCGGDDGTSGERPGGTSAVSTTDASASTSTSTASPPTTAPEPDEESPMTTPPSGADLPSVQTAIRDLAGRLQVDVDHITVVSVEEVTWRDGSLGCPEPGRVYTQALVDGQRIVLAVDGVEYEYHVGRSGEPFYCPADRVVPPVSDPRI